MKRRNFFKGLASVIAGFAVAPVVIEKIKEIPLNNEEDDDYNDYETSYAFDDEDTSESCS